jgi:Protochlamydia outer membrane protein
MTGWKRWISLTALCGWLTIVGLACAVQIAAAQGSIAESRPRFDFAIGTWISTGDTRWEHDASSIPGLGDPTSKLKYKDVGTNVIELTGKVWVTPKWFGRLNVGYAGIGGGRLTDDDYGSNGGQRLFSSTNSDLSGDGMWYLNADGGFRVAEYPNHRGWLEVFGGFQYWYTKYEATGLAQMACDNSAVPPLLGLTCNPAGTVTNQGQTVITNTSNWYSIRAGASTEYRLTRRLSLMATAAFLPLTIIDNEDIHHLRTSGAGALQQNPSISMEGWGVGADADVGLRLMLVKNIFLNVGYRVWWNHAIDGDVTFHGVSGSSEYPMTQFDSLRHGLTAGLNFTF